MTPQDFLAKLKARAVDRESYEHDIVVVKKVLNIIGYAKNLCQEIQMQGNMLPGEFDTLQDAIDDFEYNYYLD